MAELAAADIGRARDFRARCEFSESETIDQLIARFPKHRDSAALMVAAALCECHRKMQIETQQPGWHRPLYLHAFADSQSMPKPIWTPKLTVVTFNYDIAIEVTLSRKLFADYEIDFDEAWQFVHSLPIHHVHGKLQLPMSYGSPRREPMKLEWRELVKMASGLRFAFEASDSDQMRPVREAIWRADRIGFVGFGFNEANLRKIGIDPTLPEWRRKVRLLVSTAKLSPEAMKSVAALTGGIGFYGGTDFDLHHFVDKFLGDKLASAPLQARYS